MIVAHDGAAWLPRVMDALAKQTRPVQRVVAVDTGSTDRGGSMLAQAFGRAAVFGMDRATGYGVAVAKALRHRSANAHVPLSGSSRDDRTEWVWLLHDDSEPAPDALQRLLAGAREAPQAAVFGPKIMDWSDRDIFSKPAPPSTAPGGGSPASSPVRSTRGSTTATATWSR